MRLLFSFLPEGEPERLTQSPSVQTPLFPYSARGMTDRTVDASIHCSS